MVVGEVVVQRAGSVLSRNKNLKKQTQSIDKDVIKLTANFEVAYIVNCSKGAYENVVLLLMLLFIIFIGLIRGKYPVF